MKDFKDENPDLQTKILNKSGAPKCRMSFNPIKTNFIV